MAKVHFMWWGDYRAEALERAIEVAAQCPHAEVLMWVKDDQRAAFTGGLPGGSRVSVRSVSTLRDVVGAAGYAAQTKLVDRAQQVRAELDGYRAFAAVKDLTVPLILFGHGGYYLDTTARFVAGGAATFDAVAAAAPARAMIPKVAANNGRVQKHVPTYLLPERIASGFAASAMQPFEDKLRDLNSPDVMLAPIDPARVLTLRSIDVWALAAPAGSQVMVDMASAYVARGEAMGLTPGTPATAPGRRILGRARSAAVITAMPDGPDRKLEERLVVARNNLIGNMAIQSAHDAFLKASADEDSYAMPFRITTETVNGNQVGRGSLDGWGIQKVFGGSWRTQVAAAPAPAPAAAPVVAGP